MGFIFTNLPSLLQSVGVDSESGFGIAMACYAGLQFPCSPVLGALRDRIGRKPVLMPSMSGSLVDFLTMAFAGRMIAGCLSGNTLLISAFIADRTSPTKRTAAFGADVGIGPLIGGVVAEFSPRAPFLSAAALSVVSLTIMKFVIRDVWGTAKRPTAWTSPYTARLGFQRSLIRCRTS